MVRLTPTDPPPHALTNTPDIYSSQATKVKALGDYTAASEEELSFPKGASMFVAAKHNDKFWKGVYVALFIEVTVCARSRVSRATISIKPSVVLCRCISPRCPLSLLVITETPF